MLFDQVENCRITDGNFVLQFSNCCPLFEKLKAVSFCRELNSLQEQLIEFSVDLKVPIEKQRH